jgi:LPXTG-motif cell wall-anchored protein
MGDDEVAPTPETPDQSATVEADSAEQAPVPANQVEGMVVMRPGALPRTGAGATLPLLIAGASLILIGIGSLTVRRDLLGRS